MIQLAGIFIFIFLVHLMCGSCFIIFKVENLVVFWDFLGVIGSLNIIVIRGIAGAFVVVVCVKFFLLFIFLLFIVQHPTKRLNILSITYF